MEENKEELYALIDKAFSTAKKDEKKEDETKQVETSKQKTEK